MIRKLGYIEFFSAVQELIEKNTGKKCYDYVAEGAESPFYILEITSKRPENTKTMLAEVFTIWVHSIASPSKRKEELYQLMQDLEEALMEEIQLPDNYVLIYQDNNGITYMQQDETDEWHSIIEFDIKVAYGLRTK